MNNKRTIIWTLAGALTLVILLLTVTGVWAEPNQSTLAAPSAPLAIFSDTLTFQGRLLDNASNPVDGSPAMTFRVYTQAEGGAPVWEDGYNVPVENGLFNASLEIPPALFDGQALWLGVQVEGDGQEMQPRQQLLPAPYALYAKRAPWGGLADIPPDLADGDDDTHYSAETGLSLIGTQFSIALAYRMPQGCANGAIAEWNAASSTWDCGSDDVGSGAAAWLLGGNAGTTPGTDILGTTDAASLTLVVNGVPALRLETATVPNLIGGYRGNGVTSGVQGATISGGGESGYPNLVTADYGTIGGGISNTASGYVATVGGGTINTASDVNTTISGGFDNTASGADATVGGGANNTASSGGATVSGGVLNTASGADATVGGGHYNTASGDYATVGGGSTNVISGTAAYATIGGGYDNTASSDYGTISGGTDNIVSGTLAAVGGGESNTASNMDATIGGGSHNTASSTYATVGGGSTNTVSGDYATVGGGYDNTASGYAATVSGGYGNTVSGDYSFAAGYHAQADHYGSFVWSDSKSPTAFSSQRNYQFRARAYGGFRFEDGESMWVEMAYLPTTPISTSTGAYLSGGGVWTNSSDRNLKENFEPVDSQDVLDRLAGLPISTWNYKAGDPNARHMGPVAQDFYATFGLGEDDRHIAALDTSGVALAAIQELHAKNQALEAENAALQTRVDDLETENAAQEEKLNDLEARLALLEQAGAPHPAQSTATWWLPLTGVVIFAGTVVARRRQRKFER